MGRFEPLPAASSSPLALAARSATRGLAEALRLALSSAAPGDPARPACDTLLHTLEQLLGSALHTVSEPDPFAEPVPTLPPAPLPAIPEKPLQPVLERFLQSQKVQEELGALVLPDLSPSELLRWGQFLSLRLSQSQYELWRKEWPKSQQPIREIIELPGEANLVLLPGSADGLDLTEVRLSTSAPCDPRLPTNLGPAARALAPLLTVALWFIQNDSELRHGYRYFNKFGLSKFTAESRGIYEAHLLERFRRFATLEQDGTPVEALKAWIELEEGVQSLAYNPLPARSSWWSQFLAKVRSTCESVQQRARDVGHGVMLSEATGEYASVKGLTGKDDIPVLGPVPRGHVSRCVRMQVRIDSETLPGRVYYRGN